MVGVSTVESCWRFALGVGSLVLVCMVAPVSHAQQQIFPAITLECLESEVEFEFTSSSDSTMVHCTLENPTAYSEDVSIGYDAGPIASSGPTSLTVESGSEESFNVELGADKTVGVGIYEVTVSAQVTGAGGVPVGFLTDNETHTLDAIVPEFIGCNVNYGQGSVTADAGDDVAFSASYSCDSNRNQSLSVELHLVSDSASQEGMWPSGFNDISEQSCIVEVSGGSGYENCQFTITTPANLVEDWEGCLIVMDDRTLTAQACQVEDSLPLKVNAKESGGSSVGFAQNGSLFEDLGISEDQEPYVIGGTVALVTLLAIIVTVLRRR